MITRDEDAMNVGLNTHIANWSLRPHAVPSTRPRITRERKPCSSSSSYSCISSIRNHDVLRDRIEYTRSEQAEEPRAVLTQRDP
jgi:hypothetical protein